MWKALCALRSALYVVFLAVTVVPWALAVVICSTFVSGQTTYRMCVGWLDTAIWGAKVICGVHARLHGFDHLPNEPVVLLPKHQSAWETFAFPGLMLPHPLAYVFKKELLKIPFFGWAMSRMDMIHIDRAKRSEAWKRVAEQGKAFMEKGHWVIMFPEGTRIERGQKGKYQSGGARLAVETQRAVLPVAVTSARCWPRKSFVLRPGVIDVSVGPLIPTIGRKPDEVTRDVEAWIEGEMRRLDPEAYVGTGADAAAAAAPKSPA